jgi:hypothetical protein
MPEPSSCCAPSVEAPCCEPAAKETCCGTSTTAAAGQTATCGCAAGSTATTSAEGDDPLTDALPVSATGEGDAAAPARTSACCGSRSQHAELIQIDAVA